MCTICMHVSIGWYHYTRVPLVHGLEYSRYCAIGVLIILKLQRFADLRHELPHLSLPELSARRPLPRKCSQHLAMMDTPIPILSLSDTIECSNALLAAARDLGFVYINLENSGLAPSEVDRLFDIVLLPTSSSPGL